jgi:hypothetical protein
MEPATHPFEKMISSISISPHIMRIHWSLLSLLVLFLLASCGTEPAPGENKVDAIGGDSLSLSSTAAKKCIPSGKILAGNQFTDNQEKVLLAISAEEETADTAMGESHRVLTLYSLQDCSVLFRQALPVNQSPDFPYYLSQITYNNINRKIAIRGTSGFYLFDLGKPRLSGPYQPEFLNKRYAEDASAGNIVHMEVWEDYLVGWVSGYGAFACQVGSREEPLSVLPAAEYRAEESNYHSLFLLPSFNGNDGLQALMPVYDAEQGIFNINSLFDKPLYLQQQLKKSFRNNRFLILREKSETGTLRPFAIDMAMNNSVSLPQDMMNKKDTEIINWLRAKQK